MKTLNQLLKAEYRYESFKRFWWNFKNNAKWLQFYSERHNVKSFEVIVVIAFILANITVIFQAIQLSAERSLANLSQFRYEQQQEELWRQAEMQYNKMMPEVKKNLTPKN